MPGPKHSHHSSVGAAVLVVALGAVLSGCASSTTKTYTVTIDAISRPTASSGFAYVLDANNPSAVGFDSRNADVVQRIHTALSQRGMYEAPNPANADFIVSFQYGERAPKTQVSTVTQPVMVQPTIGSGMGSAIPGGGIGTYPGGAAQYPGNNPYGTNTPQVVMVQTTQVTQTSEKYLRISARANPTGSARGGQPSAEVWSVEAVIDDESVDAYNSIPALIDAAIEYIGLNTPEPQKVVVRLDS